MPRLSVDERRARIRERIEFLERSIIRWHEVRVDPESGISPEAARAQIAQLECALERERRKYESIRSELELPWFAREVDRG